MATLVGNVEVLNVTPRQYEDKKYFSVQSISPDKCVYCFSAPLEDHPEPGDLYQMVVQPDFKCKASVVFVKEK
jgi:hypothetical protein